jgi:hypothetical protein
MHWEYVSKLQLLYPVDEHHGYCPNLWAAEGVASLVTEITVAKISSKRFIGDTIVEEPSSATAHLLHGSEPSPSGAVLGASNKRAAGRSRQLISPTAESDGAQILR